MKFLHTADLHIGKTVNGFSMLEDQRHILRQMLELAVKQKVQAVVIAGDVYDRSIPTAEAVGVLDEFLTACGREEIRVLCIAGNHDSPERISFAEGILKKQGIYLAGSFSRALRHVRLEDAYGEVDFTLLPYVKPALAKAGSSMEAVAGLLREDGALQKEGGFRGRRVLVTHFFVTDAGRPPELSDSETTVNVGGLDQVEAALFADYDYVALGHIHKPQKIGSHAVYFAGSPLKYSFSEWQQEKSVNLVEMNSDGVEVKKLPLTPLREMRVIQGRLEELVSSEVAALADKNAYVQARLTDETELIDPMGTLRTVYPNLMQLVFCRKERQDGMEKNMEYQTRITGSRKSTPELFEDFYRVVREEEMDEERRKIVTEAFLEV